MYLVLYAQGKAILVEFRNYIMNLEAGKGPNLLLIIILEAILAWTSREPVKVGVNSRAFNHHMG